MRAAGTRPRQSRWQLGLLLAPPMAWLVVVAAWLVARPRAGLQHWRGPLAYLAVSTLLATAVVAWIKSWSNMDCPWDLLRYGGERPYVGLLGLRPVGLSRGACFPAGHASAGYAWLSLYFFFRATRPRLRWIGLLAGATAGLVFGASQQLRGAHFLSHDVWTAALCWMVAFALSSLGTASLGHVVVPADQTATVDCPDHAPPPDCPSQGTRAST